MLQTLHVFNIDKHVKLDNTEIGFDMKDTDKTEVQHITDKNKRKYSKEEKENSEPCIKIMENTEPKNLVKFAQYLIYNQICISTARYLQLVCVYA